MFVWVWKCSYLVTLKNINYDMNEQPFLFEIGINLLFVCFFVCCLLGLFFELGERVEWRNFLILFVSSISFSYEWPRNQSKNSLLNSFFYEGLDESKAKQAYFSKFVHYQTTNPVVTKNEWINLNTNFRSLSLSLSPFFTIWD